MKVEVVPIEWVPRVWPQVEAFLVEAIKYSSGDYTPEHVQVLVSTGQWALLVATDEGKIHGAATVHFFNRPKDRVAFVTTASGRFIINEDTFEQLKAIVASLGATALEGAMRESVARLCSRRGFTEKYRILGVKI